MVKSSFTVFYLTHFTIRCHVWKMQGYVYLYYTKNSVNERAAEADMNNEFSSYVKAAEVLGMSSTTLVKAVKNIEKTKPSKLNRI